MSEHDAIRAVVAGFLGVEAERLVADFPLGDRLRNSIARAGLQARLHRELGRMPPPVVAVATYGQLERLVLTGAAGDVAPTPARQPHRPDVRPSAADHAPGPRCGIDIEAVESLPEAADYWSHPFYTDSFSPAEIAECVRDATPRERFAARWCAKEALLKCDPTYRDVPLAGIELRKDENGAPRLYDAAGRLLPVAVSLSHAGGFAAAVVVAGGMPAAVSSPLQPAPAAAPRADAATRLMPLVTLAAAAVALAISLVTAACVWTR